MRIDRITVELRPRSSWEAAELGIALVRHHPRAIWKPWLIATLPVFVVLNAIGWWLELLPWAALVFWWLKPVFDRIPLFVLSRAVFGQVPTVRETLDAQRTWGWRWMLHYLTWRRFGLYRSLYLPVDLLEGGEGKHARRNVIGGSARGVAAWLTIVFVHFEIALIFGVMALVPLFIPFEQMRESFDAMRESFFVAQPAWTQVATNLLYYAAATAMEPFYVGAGFGLYLNRRTQLEAWDVELAFRRLRARIGGALMVACLAVGVAFAPARDVRAADETAPSPPAPTMREALGPRFVDDKAFVDAVAKVKQDPLLNPTEKRTTWVPRDKQELKKKDPSSLALKIAEWIGNLLEAGLWLALGALVVALVVTAKRWWPWLRGVATPARADPSAISHAPTEHDAELPADIAASVRRLWAEGLSRRALALLYRASVESMVARTGAFLVPGATEAECLRASRALGAAEDRDAFARVVRTWQYAAYADRLPDGDAFEALVSNAAERFGWAA
jgi:hypothetical protein